ncbi:MAG: adenosine kinase [Rectinemataceae bacterium]|nr:adenosine kinase [Rectinemataceae bacterium]
MMHSTRSIYAIRNRAALERLAGSGKLFLTGIGNPLVDIIVQCDSVFMKTIGITPCTINHIQYLELENILDKLPPHTKIPGGGAANTCRMASLLGGNCVVAGCIGDDDVGGWYEDQLAREGVRSALRHIKGQKTGIFCTFIHPDGTNTRVVAPGAANSIDVESLDPEIFEAGRVLLAEGFLARKPDLLESVLMRGSISGMTVAMDLGSADFVVNSRELLARIIPEYCDIVFANEAEFFAFTGCRNTEESMRILPQGTVFVIKKGDRGAESIFAGEYTDSPVLPLEVFDETGAGDAFAGGFLASFSAGCTASECLRNANNLAGRTVMVPGASLSKIEACEAWAKK